MHLVDTRAEKVPAFSGHGNHCSPARTGVFYYSDGCTSVCLGAHSAVAQCYSLPPALCVHSGKAGTGMALNVFAWLKCLT